MSVRGGRVEPELSIWVLAAVTLGLLVSCGDYRHAKDEPFVFVDELSVAELSFEPSQLRSVGTLRAGFRTCYADHRNQYRRYQTLSDIVGSGANLNRPGFPGDSNS